jgi:hypothetical protein
MWAGNSTGFLSNSNRASHDNRAESSGSTDSFRSLCSLNSAVLLCSYTLVERTNRRNRSLTHSCNTLELPAFILSRVPSIYWRFIVMVWLRRRTTFHGATIIAA